MPKKDDLDQFYTSPSVAKDCWSELRKHTQHIDAYVEPSAGAGSFSDLPPQEMVHAFDLDPQRCYIKRANWFDVELSGLGEQVCVFGNPPFGDRNNLSRDFIKHAISFDNVKIVAMILPAVFRKPTNQRVFGPDWSLVKDIDAPKDSFLLDGRPYHVPCVFQIWVRNYGGKRDCQRKSTVVRKECDAFKIVKRDENPDFFVFGAAPNKVIEPHEVNENNRGYYIKAKRAPKALANSFREKDWKGHSSVNGGVFWLTSTELVEGFEND